jgi:diguanylate cyclase (GGDEF)-like protein
LEDYKEKYDVLMFDYENYQNTAEKSMQTLNQRVITLEKKLDAFANIVEVSRYINLNMNDTNLIYMINDMLIGVLGVTYATIYTMMNERLSIKVTNKGLKSKNAYKIDTIIKERNYQPFLMNYEKPIYDDLMLDIPTYSVIGVPIELQNKLLGYILLEHSMHDFFNKEHMIFMQAITNQIAVTIENNILYQKVIENHQKIFEVSIRDPLLGIYNRRYFFDSLVERIKSNYDIKFGIVMIDLDTFKKVNDTYGHVFGDEVLKSTTRIIQNNIDDKDMLARFGGEEFVIYINDILNMDAVIYKIEKIRRLISENLITHESIEYKVTASFGLSIFSKDAYTLDKTLEVADARLYKAKLTGKNKVVFND